MNHDSTLTYKIIGVAMRVHRNLGPGLLESVYRRCLCHELALAGIPFEQEVYPPIHYDGIDIASGYRADIIVRDEVLLELKAVEHLGRLHEAQLLTLSTDQPMPARSADEFQCSIARIPPPRPLTTLPVPSPGSEAPARCLRQIVTKRVST